MSLALTVRASRRIDWSAVKDRISIKAVAVELLGPPQGRGGSRGLWWPCPLHDDRNPSFQVDPERGRWKCFGCGESGDAIALVMRREGLTFPKAKQRLASMFGLDGGGFQTRPPRPRPPSRPPRKPPDKPSGLPVQEAESAVREAVERLWGPAGKDALAYLRGERFLTDETIQAARLGFVQGLRVPTKSGKRFPATGITIPWFDNGRLAAVKIRRTDGRDPKYIEAFRDHPSLFAPFGVRPGDPLIVAEGEFDALLLGQELGRLASVATLGSASGERSAAASLTIATAPTLYVATDADGAGDKAADAWPKRAVRVRPPDKDWTEVRAGGFGRIAYTWGRFLPLGDPPRPEDFFDPAAYALPPDETDIIEAIEERRAIQEADGIFGGPPPSLGPAEWLAELHRLMGREGRQAPAPPSTRGYASFQSDAKPAPNDAKPPGPIPIEDRPETEIEAADRALMAVGFVRVDPAELDRLIEFDPPAVDERETTQAPPASRPKRRRSGVATGASWF